MNKNPLFYKGLIWCFGALYALVAFISFWHCIAFCLVGNPVWISVMMSFAFEVGLAATLFSVLTTDNKNNYVAWLLMTFLTGVQVIGNVYSVYKYMVESGTKFYVYIQDSMLHWFVEDVPTNEIMSIISIILGALLPIVALLMTAMVSNNLKLWFSKKEEQEALPASEPVPDNEFSNKAEMPVVTSVAGDENGTPAKEEEEQWPTEIPPADDPDLAHTEAMINGMYAGGSDEDLMKSREEFYKALDEYAEESKVQQDFAETPEIPEAQEEIQETSDEEELSEEIPTEEPNSDTADEEDFNLDFKEEQVPEIPIQEAVVEPPVADVSLLDIDNAPAEKSATETLNPQEQVPEGTPLDPSCGCIKRTLHGQVNGGEPFEVMNTIENHQHDWEDWKKTHLPNGQVIDTSVITDTINQNIEVMRQNNGPFSVFRPKA